jgi:hypothetical protein
MAENHIVKLSDVRTISSLSLEKKALKAYKGKYYLVCKYHFIVEPNGETILPCKRKFDAAKLSFDAAKNQNLISDLNIANKKFHKAIKSYAPEKIQIGEFKLDNDPKTIDFIIIKDKPTMIINDKNENIFVEQSKINSFIPTGSMVRFAMILCACYDIESKELSFYQQVLAIKVLNSGKIISDDVRALM